MPSGHVCIQCGEDLSRLRVKREPHYGLPVITCPSCGVVVVRREHPLRAWWKRAMRMDAMLTALLLHGVMIAACTVVAIGQIDFLGQAIKTVGFVTALEANTADFIATFILTPMLLGAYLTAGFVHWRRRWLPWPIAFGFLSVLLLIRCMVMVMDRSSSGAMAGQTIGEYIEVGLGWWMIDLTFLAATIPATLVGIPVGGAVLGVARKFRWTRYRWRRRQQRRNQLAQ